MNDLIKLAKYTSGGVNVVMIKDSKHVVVHLLNVRKVGVVMLKILGN